MRSEEDENETLEPPAVTLELCSNHAIAHRCYSYQASIRASGERLYRKTGTGYFCDLNIDNLITRVAQHTVFGTTPAWISVY